MSIESGTERVSKNDVTGDTIKSKVTVDNKFAEGFDRIWGPKVEGVPESFDTEREMVGGITGVPKPPAGYTAEELEQDSPYNQWMYE